VGWDESSGHGPLLIAHTPATFLMYPMNMLVVGLFRSNLFRLAAVLMGADAPDLLSLPTKKEVGKCTVWFLTVGCLMCMQVLPKSKVQ
jgi:hypothetical protein